MTPNTPSGPRGLAERIDLLELDSWRSRCFSRVGIDSPAPEGMVHVLNRIHAEFGIGVYRLTDSASQKAMVPVFVNEPIPIQSMRDAECIEFQFFPSHSERQRNGRQRNGGLREVTGQCGAGRGDWKPVLPSDMKVSYEIRDRVALAKRISHRSNVVVGAAVAAAKVGEDIPFLIECGFDYACLIVDACYRLQPGHRVSIALAESAIADALDARIRMQRPEFGIRLAANGNLQQMATWLVQGIESIAIDSWLQDRAPPEESRIDSFGGILVEASRGGSGANDWICDRVGELVAELHSEQQFFEG
jgi:hypothetical protein